MRLITSFNVEFLPRRIFVFHLPGKFFCRMSSKTSPKILNIFVIFCPWTSSIQCMIDILWPKVLTAAEISPTRWWNEPIPSVREFLNKSPLKIWSKATIFRICVKVEGYKANIKCRERISCYEQTAWNLLFLDSVSQHKEIGNSHLGGVYIYRIYSNKRRPRLSAALK